MARGGGHHSDMEFETLAIQHAPIGIALTERRIIRACNPAFAAIFGAAGGGGATEVFADMDLMRLYPSAEDYHRIGAEGLARMRADPLYLDERVMRRLDGALFWCRVRGRSLSAPDPFDRAVWTFADMSAERPVLDLSPRERVVAMRTCQGQTAKEIARDLGLSHRTVEQHRARLFRKAGAANKAEFVAFFMGMASGPARARGPDPADRPGG
ncbi:PAS domain-containing protein [Phaeovulum vinaykumarii]|uniref:Transcriptional regulator, LuxR family n=2 Tax=Phaeovulum vinaykumarii TaxID=407234 RepID=A0A1N7M7P5_9RHOB|nr:transcriptional regulator, LuxR family [Phaeovulum vinaykumarii]SOC11199.1 PAS domain-containing protein [Phaeovulum vinaykumarii]